MEKTVTVALGARRYDVLIGPQLIERAGGLIHQAFGPRKFMIVSDETVGALYLERLRASLSNYFSDIHVCLVPAGEASKDFTHLQLCAEAILAARLERGDFILALGGGVIGDLAGFAASIVRRGVQFIQMPTSLLAQVDSSVGGKTAINSPQGKNLIGSFYQPRMVLADSFVLDSLPRREFAAGYAEIVKYGLINQPDFFAWLEQNHREIFSGKYARVEAISRAVASKAAIVSRDEHENGERALLNLGHTFGHALEAVHRYDPKILVHGEGVAIGLVLAYEFSEFLGLLSSDHAVRIRSHLRQVGLPTTIGEIPASRPSAQQLLFYMNQDKKVESGSLTFILAKGLGQAFIAKNIDPMQVIAFLQQKLSEA